MVKDWVRPLGFLFVVGWYVALSIVIPSGVGYWLDTSVFNTTPLYTLVGLGFGTLVAFFGLYRMLHRFQAETGNPKAQKEDTPLK